MACQICTTVSTCAGTLLAGAGHDHPGRHHDRVVLDQRSGAMLRHGPSGRNLHCHGDTFWV